MGIIADTGIALEIMSKHPGMALYDATLSWIKDVVARILPPCPRGKRVVMFISPGIYRDYKARMSGKADTSTPPWHVLRKFQFTRYISHRNRLVFTIQLVNTSEIDASDWDGDRFDRPFYTLLEAVKQRRSWENLRIIFASKDRDTCGRMRDLSAGRDPRGRVHFADDLSACEELVMC